MFKLVDRVLIGVVSVIALLMIVGSIRYAQAAGTTATLTWTHPAIYIDNTPLAVADIANTIITLRRTAGGPVAGTLTVPAPATTIVAPNLVCGDFVFTARTVMRTANLSSDETNGIAYTTGVTCKANPPGGLTAS